MKTQLIPVIILLILPGVLFGQKHTDNDPDTYARNSSFEAVNDTIDVLSIFDDPETLNISLEYDITSFIRKKKEGDYLDAVMTIYYNESLTIEKNIRLKARGKNRRDRCYFPPIYLNFKTDPIKTSDLKGIKKIKMVTHCSSTKQYKDYILREYLVYKLYNVITDYSFRVRLLNIKYIDTGKRKKNYENVGFLIEPDDLLAKRHNCVEIKNEFGRKELVDPDQGTIMALFQYMIGNTDWRIKSGHNMKFFKPTDVITSNAYPVPYDFDYCGVVNTGYSAPQEWANIETVRDREYLGYCRDKEEYKSSITHFLDRKAEIMETIHSFPHFDDKENSRIANYIESFYKILETRNERMVGIMQNECRTDF